MRQGGDVEDRKLIGQAVEAGVVAERPLGDKRLLRVDISLNDEVGAGRHFEIDRLAFHQLDRPAA